MYAYTLLASLLATTVTAAPQWGDQHASLTYFNNRTIFQTPSDYNAPGTLYARSIQLSSGSLLATWENYSPEPPQVSFPIFQSDDLGASWQEIAHVEDRVYGYGLRYQPFLYELPRNWAGWQKGTIFLAGSAIPTNLSSTHIELYASEDQGKTWKFVSHIAAGGEAVPDNGLTPVWEPFLMLHGNKLVCYYSDQRDPSYGQKLVHQTTQDGLTWSAVVDDVTMPVYTDRPGMTTVAKMSDGRFVLTFENGGGLVNGQVPPQYTFPVYYKISSDPLNFGAVEAQALVSSDGTVPVSSPYVIFDDKAKRLIVSCGTDNDVFTNDNLGDAASWKTQYTGERTSYTRNLGIIRDHKGQTALHITGGGLLPPAGQHNQVADGVVDMRHW
jgi:hypothetical protein